MLSQQQHNKYSNKYSFSFFQRNQIPIIYIIQQAAKSMKKKGKGLSFDQKRQKILAIFHRTKDAYNYKDVQNFSVKAGIPFPSVKQILDSLKADNLVQCQKIGAGVFYWSFPSKSYQTIQNKIQQCQKQIDLYNQQNAILQTKIQQSKLGRQDCEQRTKLLENLSELEEFQKQLRQQIEEYIRFDPQRVDLLKKQNKELKEVGNRWTDNLEQIKKFIKKQEIGITDTEIEAKYEIPADLDYME